MFKRLFCTAYFLWLDGFVDKKSDPLVRLMDIFESSCKYCQIARWIMATAGITLALCGHWMGLLLPVLAYLLALGEKFWLCDLPKK